MSDDSAETTPAPGAHQAPDAPDAPREQDAPDVAGAPGRAEGAEGAECAEAAEGVIRFRYTLAEPDLVDTPPVATLRWAQGRGRVLGVLGRDAERYDGLAFGNLSVRAADGEGFWITASQRIDVDALAAEDIVRIARVTVDGGVDARGTRPPSSETLTHAAVHGARRKGALVVLHGHAPTLWAATPEGWGETPEDAGNGTRALADAVAEAVTASPDTGALVLRGHRDGILLWGTDFSELGQRLARALDHPADATAGGAADATAVDAAGEPADETADEEADEEADAGAAPATAARGAAS